MIPYKNFGNEDFEYDSRLQMKRSYDRSDSVKDQNLIRQLPGQCNGVESAVMLSVTGISYCLPRLAPIYTELMN